MTLPFQSHSQTSLLGALEASRVADSQIQKIVALLEQCGAKGATGREIAARLKMQTGTVSARLRDMQLRELAKKSDIVRNNGNVWFPYRYNVTALGRKRDRAKEALELVEAMKKEGHGDEVMTCLDRLSRVLK